MIKLLVSNIDDTSHFPTLHSLCPNQFVQPRKCPGFVWKFGF